ncbi:MAG TPA: TIGR03089 family protein, partial [Pilimelia sp.]|nr:TIGR03089 family protein [Pilimelia sp.]
GDRFALGLAPLGAPLRALPPGCADYVVEVRGQGDRFVPAAPVRPPDPALDGSPDLSHTGLLAAAARRAAALGLAGGRVLMVADTHPDPLDWLLAPLVAGASTVLCARPDPAVLAARAATERVTLTLP